MRQERGWLCAGRANVFALYAGVVAWGSMSGCTTGAFERSADASALRILEPSLERVRRDRRENLVLPVEVEEISSVSASASAADEVYDLGLAESLAIATQTNRSYITERERIYLSALSLGGTRRDFLPQVNAVLDYLFSDGSGRDLTQTAGVSASIDQILPWGGSVSLRGDSGLFNDPDNVRPTATTYQSGLSLSVNQPLLRGAGTLVTREPLRQAERNLIYDLRDFELFRQDFAIDVATRFYDLVQQQRSIENVRVNLETFEFLHAQAEAFFQVGRGDEREVLRARRNELNARNDLIRAQEAVKLSLDRFKVFLGLSTDVTLLIRDEAPDYVEVRYDLDSALEIARENRLDYITREDRLQDAERAVRIRSNSLLPDLDVSASLGVDTLSEPRFDSQGFSTDDYSVGVTFGLPLTRYRERNNYRASQIAYGRAKRDFVQFRDNLTIDIKSAFRSLLRRKQTLEIQRERIGDEERSVRKAFIDFESGDANNRDVVEAQQSLTQAQNALISERVSYEISRLQLMRDLGILFIEENGMWSE